MITLALNAGSSSLKYSVLDTKREETLIEGRVERINTGSPEGQIVLDGEKQLFTLEEDSHKCAVVMVFEKINAYLAQSGQQIEAVGHRVVHGGSLFSVPTRITESVLSDIRSLSPLAPLHNPANADVIEVALAEFPQLPHVAVFDTAYHQTISEEVYRYAVPNEWYDQYQVRRYGFHGTSHSYVSRKAIETFNLSPENSNIIVAHLGNGCSATAIHGGKSVDTTMGLSPLEGFVMGTRSGNVDPNLHSYIAAQAGLSLDEITNILNKKSGIYALSGGESDMRNLQEMINRGDESAQRAESVFVYRLAKEILGLMAALPGSLDVLVFTGGIGENNSVIREKLCARLASLDIELNLEENAIRSPEIRAISQPDSQLVAIIPTNEELEIAIQTEQVVTAV